MPGRRPSGEVPTINSTLCWEDVVLPSTVTVDDIDRIIFAMVQPHFMKMARIVGDCVVRCRELGLPVTDEILAARIQALVREGSIEGAGDLRIWRFSEIRRRIQ